MSDILRAPPVTRPILYLLPGRFLLAYPPKRRRRKEIYTFADLKQAFPMLGGVLDLQRAPRRWYDKDIEYKRIVLPGGPDAIPSPSKLEACHRYIQQFHANHPNKLLYIHCRHGINRTMLVVVSYLQQQGIDDAASLFLNKRNIHKDLVRPHVLHFLKQKKNNDII